MGIHIELRSTPFFRPQTALKCVLRAKHKVNFQHLFLALPRDGKSAMEVGDELLSFILNLP